MYAIDPSMAANAAAQQDLQARRRQVESLADDRSDAERQAKLREACEGFEAIFIQKMWEQMRETLPKGGMMHGKEEEYWQSMYAQELGKSMASAGGIGLADMMMAQLSRNNQEISDATRDSTMRRPALNVSPAPLLPPSANVEHRADNAQAARPAMQAAASQNAVVMTGGNATATAGPASAAPAMHPDLMNIYDGEAMPYASAPQIADSMADPAGLSGGDTSSAMAGTPFSGAYAQAADDTPASVRQTLDELTRQVGGQDAEAPTITHISYQTNLPPSQRKAAPLDQHSVTRTPRPITSAPSSVPGAMGPAAGSMARAASPVNPASIRGEDQPTAATSPAAPAPDILAGIRPRFVPDRYRSPVQGSGSGMAGVMTAAMVSPASSPVASAATPVVAGGPSLTGPEEVAQPVALGNPAPPRGSLAAPTTGTVSSGFGWRLDPFTGQRAWHAGVDITAAPGESVRAAMDGVVSFAGQHPELGNLVVVDHGDGLRTFYGHNQTLDVAVGQKVSTGMEIASAGSSGRAAGTHVHFEVRRGELALNPEPLLQQGHIQLAEAR